MGFARIPSLTRVSSPKYHFRRKCHWLFFFLYPTREELASGHGQLHHRATGAALPATIGALPSLPSPPAPAAEGGAPVHLRLSRLPTPLSALSASLLGVSVVLLVALLVCRLMRGRGRRRGRKSALVPQEAPLTQQQQGA